MLTELFIPGTTPELTFSLPSSYDISEADVYMEIKSQSTAVIKSGADITVTSGYLVSVKLTQEESLQFPNNTNVEIQLNWVYNNGDRGAAGPTICKTGKQLMRTVLPEET